MEITEPYAKIINSIDFDLGIKTLQEIEAIARVSHRSEDKVTEDSYSRFIKSVVIDRGDWSVTEHCSITVEAVVDRGITHEWVRHRIGAYTQESTRFVNYVKTDIAKIIKPMFTSPHSEARWSQSVDTCIIAYKELLSNGESPQIARSVLPMSLASKLIVTYNLRMWRHFFLMRTTKETHPQMRQVTIPLLDEFKETIPLLYDDITPNSRQADNMRMIH